MVSGHKMGQYPGTAVVAWSFHSNILASASEPSRERSERTNGRSTNLAKVTNDFPAVTCRNAFNGKRRSKDVNSTSNVFPAQLPTKLGEQATARHRPLLLGQVSHNAHSREVSSAITGPWSIRGPRRLTADLVKTCRGILREMFVMR